MPRRTTHPAGSEEGPGDPEAGEASTMVDPAPTSPCLDDETLLEWHAGSLVAVEQQRVERHIDACATCRAIVAALADTTTEDAAEDDAASVLPPAAISSRTRTGRHLGRDVVDGRFELAR